MNGSAQLWIVIARPDRLPAALLAAQTLREKFPGGCHLLRERSVWWERVKWELYADRFSSVHDFDRIEKCRGLGDLPRLFREYSRRQRAMAELPINAKADVLLSLGGTMSIANAAVSAHPQVFKIFVSGRHAYDEMTREVDRYRYRFTTSSWFENRLVEPLSGLERTINVKLRINPGGDGVRISRLQKKPSEIYDAIVIVSHSGCELPAKSEPGMLTALHPSIADLDEAAAGADQLLTQPRVVFFGTPFLLVRNLEPAVYIEHLNRCLDYLRRHFGNRCRLIYRPHPVETDEVTRLQLSGFEIENDRQAAEVYMLQHDRGIEAIFSVSSTVSRSALNNGLNGYSLWRTFPFSETATGFFEKLMGDVPTEFDLRDLTDPPIAYAQRGPQAATKNAFPEVLRRAVAMRQ